MADWTGPGKDTFSESVSPLRTWLFYKLLDDFDHDGFYDDTTRAFFEWTKMDHKSCVYWLGKPGFTTCTSFLLWVHNKICDSGGIKPPYFAPFGLNVCGKNKGWHTLGEDGQSPNDGDFYQIGTGGTTRHVGVLLTVSGGVATYVSGGADRKAEGIGRISRKTGIFPPDDLMGYLNIEEFYVGWNGPAA